MPKRNATAAVIGAGDFIGSEIAKKFAAEGFSIFAGRRNGDKLVPLVKDIEVAGGEIHARSLDARKEEEVISFLDDADKHAVLVERDADHVDTEPRQASQRALVALLLEDHGVAARQQRVVDEVEGLERAGHDQEIVDRAVDAGIALEFRHEELAQGQIALRTMPREPFCQIAAKPASPNRMESPAIARPPKKVASAGFGSRKPKRTMRIDTSTATTANTARLRAQLARLDTGSV